jgi:CDGSH-type Zn-finger protein
MTTRDDPTDAAPPPAATITVTADGPYVVDGHVEIRTEDGRLVGAARKVALCRCGQSADKPYCDGSHERTGFCDPGPAAGP